MELTDSHWQLCPHQTKEKIQFTKWPLTQNDKITGSRAEARKYGECCGAGDLPAKRVARDNGDHLQSNTRAIHIKKGKSFLAPYYPICPIMHINMPQEWYLWFIYEKLETRLASPSVLQKAGDFFCKRFFSSSFNVSMVNWSPPSPITSFSPIHVLKWKILSKGLRNHTQNFFSQQNQT